MWLLLVRQWGGLGSLCLVRLVNDEPGSVDTKLRNPLLIFSFSFCCFSVWCHHDACSVKHVAAFGNWVGVRCLCSVRVVHEGQEGCMQNFKPSIQNFIVILCVYVLAGNDEFSQWGRGAWKGKGSDQAWGPDRLCAPRQPLLHPILHLASDSWQTWVFTLEYMWSVILAETTTRMNGTFNEDDQFLAFLFLLCQKLSISSIGPYVYCFKDVFQQDCDSF